MGDSGEMAAIADLFRLGAGLAKSGESDASRRLGIETTAHIFVALTEPVADLLLPQHTGNGEAETERLQALVCERVDLALYAYGLIEEAFSNPNPPGESISLTPEPGALRPLCVSCSTQLATIDDLCAACAVRGT